MRAHTWPIWRHFFIKMLVHELLRLQYNLKRIAEVKLQQKRGTNAI